MTNVYIIVLYLRTLLVPLSVDILFSADVTLNCSVVTFLPVIIFAYSEQSVSPWWCIAAEL